LLTGLATEERLRAGDLVAELNARARKIGLNTTDWPGLTMYRFEAPIVPQWSEVHSLSLCVVAQGRKAVTIDGSTYCYDPFNYLVLARGMRFEAEILEASVEKPFLSFVLQIDPAIVRRVSADLHEHTATAFRPPASKLVPYKRVAPARVTPLDTDTAGAVLRFLRAATIGPDRRVLAPMYLAEIVYRVLRAKQWRLLLEAAISEYQNDPVTRAISYIRDHLAEQLAVADLADYVCLSPSAFAHLFRDITGMSPYQFIKSVRLDRARELLVEGAMNVGEIARTVGYSSLSHFVNEFKRHFGVTPRAYADCQRNVVPLRMDLSTSQGHGQETSASGLPGAAGRPPLSRLPVPAVEPRIPAAAAQPASGLR
jgi:AraC-like DNA-binding protein